MPIRLDVIHKYVIAGQSVPLVYPSFGTPSARQKLSWVHFSEHVVIPIGIWDNKS